MTLHIYAETRGQPTLLMGVEFDCMQALEPAFERFRKATGVRLSEYDDVELGPQHLTLLHRLLKEVQAPSATVAAECRRFMTVVGESATAGATLTFVGE